MDALNMYFKKCKVQFLEDDNNADNHLIEGEYWRFKEPEEVETWSLHMIPFLNQFCFSYKFKNAQVLL